jgi:acyl-homoserine-lactone acylase
MKWWARAALALCGLAAMVLVGLASWDNLTARGSIADPVRPRQVRIERDKWGVPHIHGRTDADVAYGLAIAHAEDDFPNLEEVIAAVRGRGGAITGEDGAKIDFAGAFLGAQQLAERRYGDLSPDTRALVEAYAQGINESGEAPVRTAAARSVPDQRARHCRRVHAALALLFRAGSAALGADCRRNSAA